MNYLSFTSSFECVSLQTEKYILPAASHDQCSIEWRIYAPFSIYVCTTYGNGEYVEMLAGKMWYRITPESLNVNVQQQRQLKYIFYETGWNRKEEEVAGEGMNDGRIRVRRRRRTTTTTTTIQHQKKYRKHICFILHSVNNNNTVRCIDVWSSTIDGNGCARQ